MILAVILCFSQWASASMTQSEVAKMLHRYESVKSIEASFTQVKTLKDMNMSIKSSGTFKITRPNQILWKIKEPAPVSIIISAQEIKIQSGQGTGAQTEIYKLSSLPSGKMAKSMSGLMAWLNLDSKEIYKNYDVTSTEKNQYVFTPKDKDAQGFKTLGMTLDNKGFVKKIKMVEISDDTIDIEFGSPKIW